jgi:anti-sigma regulatory factor (Ser/Thr protein kinase)
MSNRFQITRAAEFESLKTFRGFIAECCAKYNIPEDVILDLKLAVDEACTNIIEHGYKDMDPGSIILSLRVDPDRILVQVTDFGHVFEPVEAQKPDLQAALNGQESGGFGLYLIYQTMDNIDYQSSEEGNLLTFTKLLRTG